MSLIERSFREKIVLVGVTLPPQDHGWGGGPGEVVTERHLDELALLVATAGADVVARVLQRRERPDPATYIGRGKALGLRDLSEETDADTVVFDDELSPAQSRNLEKILGEDGHRPHGGDPGHFRAERGDRGRQSPGRTGPAPLPPTPAAGPRAGVVPTGRPHRHPGPGETQLEVDRRRLVRRVHKLESELAQLERRRRLQRKGRRRSRLASVSLVGYTNAGKSTLLNALTGAGVVADERLFATLDPRTRRFALPGGEPVLVSDTVGFVRKLPHQLVEAFRSTLEVVNEADLLVHLVDSAAPEPEGQIEAVRAVLGEIGAADIPELLVFNKADVAAGVARDLAARHPGSVVVSAARGDGVEELLAAVAHQLRLASRVVELSVPFSRGDILAALHREGEVLSTREGEEATFVTARLPAAGMAQFTAFVHENAEAGTEAPAGRTEARAGIAREAG